jgi:hypothetical protein
MRSQDVPKMVKIGWIGAASQIFEIYGDVTFPFMLHLTIFISFSNSSTDQIAGLICAHDGLKDVVWFNKAFFEGCVFVLLHLGVKNFPKHLIL